MAGTLAMRDLAATAASARYTLFIAAGSANSLAAVNNLRQSLARLSRPPGTVEIIDVYERPDLALKYSVLVTPMLMSSENPRTRLIGDLSPGAALDDFLR